MEAYTFLALKYPHLLSGLGTAVEMKKKLYEKINKMLNIQY